MNTSHTPSQNSKPSPRKGRKVLRWGLLLTGIATLALVGLLGTPTGQRWLVRTVLNLAESSLETQSQSVDLGLGGVSVQWNPWGVSFENIWAVQRAQDKVAHPGDTLASLDAVTLFPKDASGLHWLHLKASGVTLTEKGQDWIESLLLEPSEGNSPPVDFHARWVELEKIRLPAQHSALGSHTLDVERLTCENLRFNGEDIGWDALEGLAELRTQGSDVTKQDLTRLTWDGSERKMAFHISTHPAFWLSGSLNDDSLAALIPDQWSGEWDMVEHDLVWQGSGSHGSIEGGLSLSGDTIILREAKWDYDGMPLIPAGLPPSGRVHLTGPLFLPTARDSTIDFVAGVQGKVQLQWAPKALEDEVNSRGFASLMWDIQSGSAQLDGRWTLDSTSTTGATRAGLALNTTLPPLSDWMDGAWQDALTITGTWELERPGDSGGSGKANGALSVQAEPSDAASWDLTFDWNGLTSPLCLTPGLELYGNWSGAGGASLSSSGNLPEDWWMQCNLNEARFIPLAGYDGRIQAAPPLAMRRLHVGARGDAQQMTMEIDGDFFQGLIQGPLDIASWWNPLVEVLSAGELITDSSATAWKQPALNSNASSVPWDVQFTVWRDDLLERYSHNQWSLGPGSEVRIRHTEGDVQFEVNASHLHIGAYEADGFRMEGEGGASPLSLSVSADGISHRQYGELKDVSVSTEVALNTHSLIRAEWHGAVPAVIEVEHYLREGNQHVVIPRKLQCQYDEAEWWIDTAQVAPIAWTGSDWRTLNTPGFRIQGNRGGITLASRDTAWGSYRSLEIQLDAFPAGPWLDLVSRTATTPIPNLHAEGLVHGALRLNPFSGNYRGELQWVDATLNEYTLGDICLEGAWGSPQGIALQQFRGTEEIMRAQTTDLRRIDLELLDWPLELLNPLLGKATLRAEGKADGKLSVVGRDDWDRAQLGGSLDIDADALYVGATGVTYTLGGRLDITPELIGMDRAVISDPEGHEAMLNLSVFHSDFSDWNYDIGLELNTPLSVMDLGADPGRLFHGIVFAVGEANVFGTTEYMQVEAKAQSASGTRFTMPLDALEGAEIPAGITFIDGNASEAPADFPAPAFDVDLSIELEVTPEAELSLVLDQKAGERVDGRATGSLSFIRNRNRSLGMEGALVIEEGQYRFSLRDLFSKNISIAPGGRIDWDGDPYEAELDLLAVAPMKTNPSPLIPNMVEREKTEVIVGMGIRGALSSPQLDFSIDFPRYVQSDPAMLAQVNAALSTPEEIERQAFALLATGQFIRLDQNNVQSIGVATAAAQASDLVSAGVSELLSSLSEDVEIGLRYLPPSALGTVEGSDLFRSEDSFEMDLGLNLLNNRLKISGTFGAQGVEGFDVDRNDLQGTFDVRYQLTPDGRWELVGYRKPQSTLDTDPRHGFGAVFQKRFDQISDLFRRQPTAEK